jgi:hypothetical protein
VPARTSDQGDVPISRPPDRFRDRVARRQFGAALLRDLTAEKLLEHSRLPLAWRDQRTALGFA